MPDKLKPYVPPIMLLAQLNDAVVAGGLLLGSCLLAGPFKLVYLGVGILAFVLVMGVFRGLGLYESWRLAPLQNEIQKIIGGCLVVYLLIVGLEYLLELSDDLPRNAVLSWMALMPAILCLERAAIRTFLRRYRMRGYNARSAVIVGMGDQSRQLFRLVEENLWAGTRILGYFDDQGNEPVEGHPHLGGLAELTPYLRDHDVDIVYLALSMRDQDRIQRILADLTDSTVSVCFVPDVFLVDMLMGAGITYFGNLPIITLRESPIVGVNAILKRLEDLVLASLILLLTGPLLLAIALGIKLTSQGPVLFKQWRYGLNCRGIRIYKFRTMTVCEDGYEFTQATKCDPRVTRFGAFLRRTSLDELPQFFNVLQGRMSIVGPRPHPVAMNEHFRKVVPGYILRHKVKPGITGWAQVNGWRGETDTMEKIQKRVDYDLEYLRRWSLLFDLRIILQTILTACWRTNAY
jgi:putative colanic acid biosynthesis UDP-glucose lipid carrier transferase